jgi:predicted DsbA family dithiol-disulfide isomerase
VQVEIWSDVVCPWCYIGKRRFEAALARFGHADEVHVRWRSFQLDPSAPRRYDGDPAERLAAKYATTVERAREMNAHVSSLASAEGLTYHLDRSRGGNTFDAHRLLHLAAAHGRQDALKERLLAAYFTESEPISDPETLVRLSTEIGLDAKETWRALASDAHGKDVRADERAARALGITGVPFFVFDRKYGVSGAQPATVLLEVLNTVWAETHPHMVVGDAADAGCSDGSCPV